MQQFAHVVSHDLKEPARKIRTFGSRLKAEFADVLPDKAKLYLEKMESAATRMYSMIEGVLLYSSVNTVVQQTEPVNLSEIMESVTEDLEVIIHQKGANIQWKDLPVVEGSPLLLYQLFYNLMGNSLKFTKKGVAPVITISSESVKQPVSGNEPEYVRIRVDDNGIGFKQEQAAAIFDTFVRLNSKDKFEGTGLGLTLCRKIVERHGGSIQAKAQRELAHGLVLAYRLNKRVSNELSFLLDGWKQRI